MKMIAFFFHCYHLKVMALLNGPLNGFQMEGVV